MAAYPEFFNDVFGVLGMAPDDRRLFEAFELANAAGVPYSPETPREERDAPART
jgi:hypothetical protein